MKLFEGIIKGLDEAIEIESGKRVGHRKKVTISPIGVYSKSEIKEIRKTLELTQSTFASVIGVSTKTVEAWETGTNMTNGSARRLLGLLKMDNNLPKQYHIIE